MACAEEALDVPQAGHQPCPVPDLKSVACVDVKPRNSTTISIKKQKTLLPEGEYEISVGDMCQGNSILIIPDPPLIGQHGQDDLPTWPPQICKVSEGKALYTNLSPTPL